MGIPRVKGNTSGPLYMYIEKSPVELNRLTRFHSPMIWVFTYVYRARYIADICYVLSPPSVSGADGECSLSDLLRVFSSQGESDIPLNDGCVPSEHPSEMCTFEFREGSVTYTGNTSGSRAFYNVSDAYCINSTTERVCDAGMWLNEIILEKGRIL